MRVFLSLAGLAAVLATAQLQSVAEEPRSTRDGVYTDAQAERGQAAYKKSCGTCHGQALTGAGATVPPLAGSDFTDQWAGQTVDDLFERIQTTMPGDHPGMLARATNADILAYVLKVNKLPAGKQELPAAADALKQIQFEAAQ